MSNKFSKKAVTPVAAKRPSKLDLLIDQLNQKQGASISEMAAATGWQSHSVRGAIAGSLKKKGHHVASDMVEGERRYRIVSAAK